MVYVVDNEEELDKLTEYLDEFFKELINLIPELQDYDKQVRKQRTFFNRGKLHVLRICCNQPDSI